MENDQMEQLAENPSTHPEDGGIEKREIEKPAAAKPGKQPVSLKNPPPKKLDLSRMSPPDNLEEARLEEITIDGICGVY